ncbi:RAD9, HUS1, RAD1-interacting nuclear orphan protein 1 [Erinaceus europaeus]|uniref:RAD9, HUS1, RAD1-interacting nuclear orphan protein 1 n=1 Tax=Erinaceus europaeus TaxID=9365 RepID=A0A1S2ZY05_ERIEU|nr:RAD9, HUS1, RAD1-interacting nuclear orphan protein 1 [Erinaceus europaeus]XP_060046268.1 RAD9, HUS1, RAD1-interacting nuclear orphan protein 1 [Erinaceus europaeus]XP_060046269.1 RAD9, HUS1, RAD1-interacting nuclear orphan protein 1 [Erinaceus europaeus]XP_060046270.1 RAD9, HUS1, RAD1-interacting nuclear orphan protein 1 [Erinaceus europaeus]XP_060046271.1 RAD9, HUS1, RAD1-interacting nuclear orphan protein 1 [Erinaceus europaeus]
MPPPKKRGRNSLKAQLQFQQPPLEGAKHHYAEPPLPVTHTRKVSSKPVDHSTATSWVSPQFDEVVENRLPICRKQRQCRDQARPSGRKSSASRFQRLTFQSPPTSPAAAASGIPCSRELSIPAEKDASGRVLVPMISPQSCGPLSQHTPSLPHVFPLPSLHTPGTSPGNPAPPPPDPRRTRRPHSSHCIAIPRSPEPGPVLVTDTPEDKYGVKVTWRRRRHLLAYLQEHGKLSESQFLVHS